jgi:lycopene beta-cyclase
MTTVRTIGIRGAGLSGLSVAKELLTIDPELCISLFDRRPRRPHLKRTFCFFHNPKIPLPCSPCMVWRQVMFRGSSFERRIDVSSSPYTMIRGEDFFEHTLTWLESVGVRFYWERCAVSLNDSSISSDGEVFTFDQVIDTAFEAGESESMMWQSFAGLSVTTENAIFDPSTAILMDLQESSPEAPVSFLYVLPASRHTALVEHTTFSPTPLSKEYHLNRCSTWLGQHGSGTVTIEETEHGLIPMGLRAPQLAQGIIAGTSAGTVRPATGYAFLASQQHARHVAQHALNHLLTVPHAYPRWLTAADTVFLRALRASPQHGRPIMEKLLSSSPADALIPFLGSSATLSQAFSVWRCVPKSIMIRSFLPV